MSETNKTQQSVSIVAKAGLWYTISNFFLKGMAFITTPFFARLMSKAELGSFSNFSSWAGIMLVVTSFDLYQSIVRSKLEHEKDMDSYIWSILSLSTLWTLLMYGVFLLFPTFFSDLMKIDVKYIHIMFFHLFTAPAYSMLITKHRAFYKYKMYVVLTAIMTVMATVLSLVLVFLMEDTLAGRIIGFYAPQVLIGLAVFILLAVRGRKVKTEYWKYACVICLPLVPHILSMYLLSASDKIIITRLSGQEYTAVYSIAYSAYHIVAILFDSMNKAWAPWLLESLHHRRYEEIRKTSKLYIGVFELIILGVLILVPEIILVLGGKPYMDAIYCLPPLIASCVFQFIYTMYVNIEFYEKKTVGVSVATLIATTANIILNFIFIPLNPERSYVIAAYTTLIGYAILFILHYFLVKRMKMEHVYDFGFFLKILAATLVFAGLMLVLYDMPLFRYVILLIYGAAVLLVGYKKREQILTLFVRKK